MDHLGRDQDRLSLRPNLYAAVLARTGMGGRRS